MLKKENDMLKESINKLKEKWYDYEAKLQSDTS